jgi:hypothetical protein
MIRSVVLLRWYVGRTVIILDIIHRHVSYLKHDVSETGLSSSSGGTFSESKSNFVY